MSGQTLRMGERTARNLPVRRTQGQRRSEAEQKLLQSAMELIAEQGGGPTSLAQFGERAGFSRGIVTHHSRAALFERVVLEAQRQFAASLPTDRGGTVRSDCNADAVATAMVGQLRGLGLQLAVDGRARPPAQADD